MKYNHSVSVKKHYQLWVFTFFVFLQQSTMADLIIRQPEEIYTPHARPDALISFLTAGILFVVGAVIILLIRKRTKQ